MKKYIYKIQYPTQSDIEKQRTKKTQLEQQLEDDIMRLVRERAKVVGYDKALKEANEEINRFANFMFYH